MIDILLLYLCVPNKLRVLEVLVSREMAWHSMACASVYAMESLNRMGGIKRSFVVALLFSCAHTSAQTQQTRT